MSSPIFTIFSPTYNRAHLLGRLYQSLREQTFQDFEWVIVDDGSIDGTDKLVQKWVNDAPFPIVYKWQENAGKHVAINKGLQVARGYHFVIVDSDDWLVPNALERMAYYWDSIPEPGRESFVGVAGLFAYTTGKIVGKFFPKHVWDSNMLERWAKWGVTGDKLESFRTDVLRTHLFPEDLGRFVPEGVIWNRIGCKYRTRYFNEVVAYKEYQPDGLSSKGLKFAVQTAYARWFYFKELCKINKTALSRVVRLKAYASYTRFALHARVPWAKQLAQAPSKELWVLTLPVGVLVYAWDRVKILREEVSQ